MTLFWPKALGLIWARRALRNLRPKIPPYSGRRLLTLLGPRISQFPKWPAEEERGVENEGLGQAGHVSPFVNTD